MVDLLNVVSILDVFFSNWDGTFHMIEDLLERNVKRHMVQLVCENQKGKQKKRKTHDNYLIMADFFFVC